MVDRSQEPISYTLSPFFYLRWNNAWQALFHIWSSMSPITTSTKKIRNKNMIPIPTHPPHTCSGKQAILLSGFFSIQYRFDRGNEKQQTRTAPPHKSGQARLLIEAKRPLWKARSERADLEQTRMNWLNECNRPKGKQSATEGVGPWSESTVEKNSCTLSWKRRTSCASTFCSSAIKDISGFMLFPPFQ